MPTDPQVRRYRDPPRPGLRRAAMTVAHFCLSRLGPLVLGTGSFPFCGQRYDYLWHWYNGTYKNERAVEIPIALAELSRHRSDRVLEVGNVLSHYVASPHQVVDKYEKADGVLNEDVTEVSFPRDFDLIVTISTLEHVGFDEAVREPEKILRAMNNLLKHLAPGGRLLVTVPIGYNPDLDRAVRAGELPFTEQHYLVRVPGPGGAWRNRWREAEADEAFTFRYGSPRRGANALLLGYAAKPGNGSTEPR